MDQLILCLFSGSVVTIKNIMNSYTPTKLFAVFCALITIYEQILISYT